MAYYSDVPQMYGAMGGDPAAPYNNNNNNKVVTSSFLRAQRRRMNITPLGVALFGPWLMFCAVFAVMSFSVHYSMPSVTFAIVGVGFLIILLLASTAAHTVKQRLTNDPEHEPTWYVFLLLTCIIAWLAAVFSGDVNFSMNMQPFYDITNLNLYTAVDPGSSRGQMLMDAGRILFTDDARLDLKKSMGFKNTDMYCVAPVGRRSNSSSGQMDRLLNYDFWAVGINCCQSDRPGFHCGQFSNPNAHGGLRLMEDSQRAYFRLAVQQAEAAYNIKAMHPLFFHWMQDPVAEVNAFQDGGYRAYLMGVCAFFVWQTFLVATAVVAFSKISH